MILGKKEGRKKSAFTGALGYKIAGEGVHQLRLGVTDCDLYGHSLSKVRADAEVTHL